MTLTTPRAFVAYSSGDDAHARRIFDAVRKTNTLPLPHKYEPWQFNDIVGRPLLSPIIENIEAAPFVIADITYLNPNVVYEIAFAIGRRKRVILIKARGSAGDSTLVAKVGIFDTLGYLTFRSEEDLRDILAAEHDYTPLSVGDTLDKKAPVYLVEPQVVRPVDVLIASRIKKAGFRYRSFMPGEDSRMSAPDALRQVSSSSGIVARLLDGSDEDAVIHNLRSLFVLGLADGMGKPSLLMAHDKVVVPLDVRDAVKPFRSERDIGDTIADFCPAVVSYLTEQEPPAVDRATILASMRIGDPTAENEMTTLGRYYLVTDQFSRTLRGEVNLVVGRKGSGKTALFIRVRDRVRNDKRNIVVDLKPEGYQLIKLKEEVFEYLSEGAREHLITAFWEYLILLEVAHKLLEKDRQVYPHNHSINRLYVELRDIYLSGDFEDYGDFSERLLILSKKMSEAYSARFSKDGEQKLTSEEVTELLHTHDIPELREKISAYLEEKGSVWILFDNLDKGWRTGGVDELDSIIIRCLIEAGRKIEREMRSDGHSFNCIIFVRNDVYDNVMRTNPDYGKEMRAVLDWTDPDLLREMLRLRLISGLGESGVDIEFKDIWTQLCVSHYKGEESSEVLIRRSLMRPRNVLKIFNHCRGFAANFNRAKIDDDDITKGLKSYSLDLFNELTRELSDVLPASSDVLYQFLDCPSTLSSDDVMLRIMNAGLNEDSAKAALNLLLYYGVVGIRIGEQEYYIFDVNYDLKVLSTRVSNAGSKCSYVINPAFWPALETRTTDSEATGQELLL